MNIGISALTIDRGRSGIARYVLSLVQAFAATPSAHRFQLFVLEEDLSFFKCVERAIEIVRVREEHRPAIRNILWHQLLLPRLVRKHQLDVLHVPTYRRQLFLQPCATVATIHDLAPFYVPGKYDWKRMFYCRYVARCLVPRQHRIIAVSHTTAESIKKHFCVSSERLAVVQNGLDHARFFPGAILHARASIAERHGITGPYLLYVSRLEHPGKNHLRLLKAFERLKAEHQAPWDLVLVGNACHGAEVIHRAISHSPIRGRIHTLGFVADEDLPNLYRAADALVFPSCYEGFGLPVIEAMACGCPVICSTNGSLPEVAGDAALYVNAADTASIVKQLVRFLADAQLRERLRHAGLIRSRQFRFEETAARTLSIYIEARNEYQRVSSNRVTAHPNRPDF